MSTSSELFTWEVLVNDHGAPSVDAYLFECAAEDIDHACEQALDAYPGIEVLAAIRKGPYH